MAWFAVMAKWDGKQFHAWYGGKKYTGKTAAALKKAIPKKCKRTWIDAACRAAKERARGSK